MIRIAWIAYHDGEVYSGRVTRRLIWGRLEVIMRDGPDKGQTRIVEPAEVVEITRERHA